MNTSVSVDIRDLSPIQTHPLITFKFLHIKPCNRFSHFADAALPDELKHGTGLLFALWLLYDSGSSA